MKSMTIDEAFAEFVHHRVEFYATDYSPEYQRAEDEFQQLYDAFTDKLNDELKEQFMKLEEAINAEGMEFAVMAYKRGLADGTALPQLLLQITTKTTSL